MVQRISAPLLTLKNNMANRKKSQLTIVPSKEDYDKFISRDEQYINQPDALEPRTKVVEINGEKWRVELIEKVIEPMSAREWYIKFEDNNITMFDAMNQYADYRLEFYIKHGI